MIENGGRVVSTLEDRSRETIERAKAAGVEEMAAAQMADEADIILSIVPPAVAPETSRQFLPLIAKSVRKPTFIDGNAIAPQTFAKMAEEYRGFGLKIGDASIIGLPPKEGYTPRIYMSGDVQAETDTLTALGMEIRLISDHGGDASAVKMAYAGITKGFQAVGLSMMLGAKRAGAAEAFLAELEDTQPQFYAWFQKMLPVVCRKAYRWDDEMREIAKFLEPEQGAADMLNGAADLYRHVAQDNAQGPQSEIVSSVQAFLDRK